MAALVLGAGAACSTPPSASEAAVSPGATAPAASPQPDASALLAAALAQLTSASQFESTVTIDGEVATSLTGRTVGNGTSLVATTQGRSVEYIRIPPSAWAREPDATWVVVDEEQAPQSPLAALAAPTTLELQPGGPGTVLNATYPAASLGLEGDSAPVTIRIEGSSMTFSYEQASSGRTIVSTTILRPATDTTPIAAPAAPAPTP